jgi:hypothetical protein
MCTELNDEVAWGGDLAKWFVEHLHEMGAAECTVPHGDYIVTVRRKDAMPPDRALLHRVFNEAGSLLGTYEPDLLDDICKAIS